MQIYREVFPKKHTFLPVIHCIDWDQAERNLRIAIDSGADGAFLINHDIPARRLLSIYATLRYGFDSFWIGINMLDRKPISALESTFDNDCGLWVDDAGIGGRGAVSQAENFAKHRAKRSSWKGIYFGGVAFKYQKEIADPAAAAVAAMPYVDVITTSGNLTGSAPKVEKIRNMKSAIGYHPLAIASGMTPENVHLYMPHADCFLVATGISDSHTDLNPKKIEKFLRALGR